MASPSGDLPKETKKRCPACGSPRILPFEEDNTDYRNHPVWIGIAAGILVIGSYFLFMIISYLTFPLIVFAGILLSSRFVNLRNRQESGEYGRDKDYLCLNCNATFRE